MNLELSYQKKILETASLYRKVLSAGVAELELGGADPRVLLILLENQSGTQSEISKACNLDPAATSRMLDKMEQSGLVKRNACKESRRCFTIELTQAGEEKAREAEQVCTSIVNKSMEEVTEQELEIMMKCLSSIADKLREKRRQSI